MTYQAPVAQILLAMGAAGSFASSGNSGLSRDDAQAILSEAGRFAAARIAPLNWIGDQNPTRLEAGAVVTPPGFRQAYQEWCAGGWNGLSAPEAHGGQTLPFAFTAACSEMWNSACISFALCPLLTAGAIEAIAAHATEEIKQRYLPRMVTGEWSGTMNLTEPQSGSDLSQLRCKAKANGDGTYAISGSKIFITYGEHDFTSNIIHLVLARLEGAPAGTRGISLFLVPKFLPDGTLNDVRCHSLEHKLGIHGSPTCAMVYGDQGGATGWLIGDEHRGLACMFTMMNNARLLVGVQGVALAERALQAATEFARTRRQGRASQTSTDASPIINHPDVRRMILGMRAKTAAARMLCMATASAIDASQQGGDAEAKQRAHARASLFTPLAKSFATDVAVDVTSTALQVHGGMGFIEETGVAQYYRDARILPIYEGTNGIQAIDLVTRKLGLGDGSCFADTALECEAAISAIAGADVTARLVDTLRDMAEKLTAAPGSATTLAAATPFAHAFSCVVAGAYLAKASALAHGHAMQEEAEVDARYFIATEVPTALAAAQAAMAGADFVVTANLD